MSPAYSFRSRLLWGVLGLVTLAWLVLAAASYYQTRHEFDEMLDAQLVQASALFGDTTRGVRPAGDDRSREWSAEVGEMDEHTDHPYLSAVLYQRWDGQGTLTDRSPMTPAIRLSPVTAGFSTSSVNGRSCRVFSRKDARSGDLLQVAAWLDSREEISSEVAETLLGPLVIMLPVLGLLLVLIIDYALRPLQTLGRAISARNAENLDPIARIAVPGELQLIIDQLNQLLERLRNGLEKEKRFTADAAHELRTPIAGIRMQAQVAGIASEADGREFALGQVLAGCDRASRLIDQLLTLARLDAEEAIECRDHLNLAVFLARLLADSGRLAEPKGIRLALNVPDSAQVRTNEVVLGILVRNLVDNAIRYSPAGTTVTVSVSHEKEGFLLEVSDQGPGISAEQRQRITERFYRGSQSSAEGAGLGLAIVKQIVQRLGARLQLLDNGPGLRVQLIFPEN